MATTSTSTSTQSELTSEQVAMLSKIIEEAKKLKFYFVTVDDFSPCAPLSAAHFGKLKNTGVAKNVGALFSLDVTQLQGNPAVKRFMDSIGKIDVTSISDGPTEHMSFFTIADKLLTMLGHEVCLSSRYKSQCEESAKLKVGHMGIGSVDTLHGYPDAKIRAMGTSVHCLRPASQDSPSSSASDSSEGDCVYAEGKLTPAKFNKHQLIGTAVVTSFIEHNRHADLNPLVPVIMMCVPEAMMCVYDCTQDILLVSDPFDWIIYKDDKPTNIDKTGVFLLWIAIHHRDFLNVAGQIEARLKSTIVQRLKRNGNYDHFAQLRERRAKFQQNKSSHCVIELHVSPWNPPPPKRSRRDRV